MPLETGSSKETVSRNIRVLRKEGVTEKQAIAEAMEKAGKSRENMVKVYRKGK